MHISMYGGFPDGSDTTPAWNAALGNEKIEFGSGRYAFLTPPDKIDKDGVTIIGTGQWTTHLTRAYLPVNSFDPFIRLEGRGSRLQGFEITTLPGTTNGFGLSIYADNSRPGGKHHIEHLRIAGQDHLGTWKVALHMNGEDRTINPVGMRSVHLNDVVVFDSTAWLATFRGCLSCEWYGGGAYQGGGTTNGINVAATSQKTRIDADIDWASSSVVGSMRGPGR